ncbi:MAG: UbiA family prenyltransferase [Ruoffia tabacinasalis]|uniref:UbiA family prenyltransferase n=1 Tax=unclassified Ruoffia TaxID=2862149 RepID=UPI0026B95638
MNKINLKMFLEFVEIRTKIASFFPMMVGFLWTGYYFKEFNWLNSVIFFLAATCFDMTVTAINNTLDYHKALDNNYKEEQNVIGKYKLNYRTMVIIVFILLAISLILSLYLVWLTDPMLLLIGALLYFIGIIYTFGPLPISRTPYGEIFSSLTMGFGITFLAVFMTRYEVLLSSEWTWTNLVLNIGWFDILKIFWFSLPQILLIANIMLANNTRDLDTDIQNERRTLVYYIGRPNAIRLYQLLSFLPWIVWLTYIITGIFPWWTIVTLAVGYVHYQGVMRYTERIPQPIAFKEAIQSFILFLSMYVIALFVLLLV